MEEQGQKWKFEFQKPFQWRPVRSAGAWQHPTQRIRHHRGNEKAFIRSQLPGSPAQGTAGEVMHPAPDVPAPQSPEGRRPVCIQSRFILCNSLRAVMDTSWFLSPNSNMCAKRGIYKHGSATESSTINSNPILWCRKCSSWAAVLRGCCGWLASRLSKRHGLCCWARSSDHYTFEATFW